MQLTTPAQETRVADYTTIEVLQQIVAELRAIKYILIHQDPRLDPSDFAGENFSDAVMPAADLS